ncbi:MAG: hypothetical protein Tsb0019_26580 [Roseibium sp.]
MATRDNSAGQQKLALEDHPERSLPPTYANYDWTSDGLAERSGSDAVVYSYWDRPFACTVRRQHREPRDILPTWPLLDAPDYGRVAGRKSVLAHHPRTLGTGIAAGPGAETAIDDWLATLPRLLLRLAAPFGAQQWLALDLFRRAPELWKLFHRQTALGRLGTLSLSLELFLAAGRSAPDQRQQFAGLLAGATRETVLQRFLGRTPPPAVLATVERLPPGAGLLGERDIKSALDPGAGTSASERLARLEEKLASAILNETGWAEMADVRALMDQGLSLPRLIATIQTGLRNLTASETPAALAGLKRARAPQPLQWWLSHWTALAARSRHFPDPPIPPAPLLTPIDSAEALHLESRRMRNGVDRFLADVLAGDLYFYHFDGTPAASLCLAATGNGDWLLLDAIGENGAGLCDSTFAEIGPELLARLGSAGASGSGS